jgi:HD superfamily phosphohydrolase
MVAKRASTSDTTLPLAPDLLLAKGLDQRERHSTKSDRQEFFLPVTGFAWFYPEEVEVINHPAFQRLGRINQLGQAYLVFRGGTHKRIEHSLGAVGVIQRMISAVQFNAEKSQARGSTGFSAPLSEEEQRFLRLGALLHDIGHVAAGRTLEDELELIRKHDGDERLDVIFERDDWGGSSSRGVPSLRAVVDLHYRKYVPQKLSSKGFTPTNIVRLLIRKRPSRDRDDYAELQADLDRSDEIRFHVCSNMIGNTVCADLLDYIYRDWYHVGRPRPLEDRIFQYPLYPVKAGIGPLG